VVTVGDVVKESKPCGSTVIEGIEKKDCRSGRRISPRMKPLIGKAYMLFTPPSQAYAANHRRLPGQYGKSGERVIPEGKTGARPAREWIFITRACGF
jgi:hypothetical protein